MFREAVADLFTRMNRLKPIPSNPMQTPLKRCLTTFDITLLGVGHMVGAGIYVITGAVTREKAGPAIILSFLLAGLASMISALCYAEFATMVPKAGSAYAYTYVIIGEFWAFIIGWNILLEYLIGAASIARACSGYIESLLHGGVVHNRITSVAISDAALLVGHRMDFRAFFICLTFALMLTLNVKRTTCINNLLTMANLTVLFVVTLVGFYYADEANWSASNGGFMPFGLNGVIAGAATCFYSYVGFDSIATAGEEAKNPIFSIPIATILSMVIATSGYILLAATLTLIVPYYKIHPSAALPDAFAAIGVYWMKYLVTLGALCGMSTALFGFLFSLSRCLYAMASDGLLFHALAHVDPETQVPLLNAFVSGLLAAILALFLDLEKLVEFMSIGTLLAYTIVSVAIIILRYKPKKGGKNSAIEMRSNWLIIVLNHCGDTVTLFVTIFCLSSMVLCVFVQLYHEQIKDGAWWALLILFAFLAITFLSLWIISAHRPNVSEGTFQVPLVPFLPALSILCNIEFMVHLKILTWMRFFIWLIGGLLIYFFYGIHHSKEEFIDQ